MFAYCGNNPIVKIDPTGHFAWYALFMALIEDVTFSNWISDGIHAARNREYNALHDVSGECINGQGIAPYSELHIGDTTFSEAGCGPIAVYNALILTGREVCIS